ncbi:MAG: hypothetical protein Q9220_001845 [cf. Caloplaca sp. 1 TL-2023]
MHMNLGKLGEKLKHGYEKLESGKSEPEPEPKEGCWFYQSQTLHGHKLGGPRPVLLCPLPDNPKPPYFTVSFRLWDEGAFGKDQDFNLEDGLAKLVSLMKSGKTANQFKISSMIHSFNLNDAFFTSTKRYEVETVRKSISEAAKQHPAREWEELVHKVDSWEEHAKAFPDLRLLHWESELNFYQPLIRGERFEKFN